MKKTKEKMKNFVIVNKTTAVMSMHKLIFILAINLIFAVIFANAESSIKDSLRQSTYSKSSQASPGSYFDPVTGTFKSGTATVPLLPKFSKVKQKPTKREKIRLRFFGPANKRNQNDIIQAEEEKEVVRNAPGVQFKRHHASSTALPLLMNKKVPIYDFVIGGEEEQEKPLEKQEQPTTRNPLIYDYTIGEEPVSHGNTGIRIIPSSVTTPRPPVFVTSRRPPLFVYDYEDGQDSNVKFEDRKMTPSARKVSTNTTPFTTTTTTETTTTTTTKPPRQPFRNFRGKLARRKKPRVLEEREELKAEDDNLKPESTNIVKRILLLNKNRQKRIRNSRSKKPSIDKSAKLTKKSDEKSIEVIEEATPRIPRKRGRRLDGGSNPRDKLEEIRKKLLKQVNSQVDRNEVAGSYPKSNDSKFPHFPISNSPVIEDPRTDGNTGLRHSTKAVKIHTKQQTPPKKIGRTTGFRKPVFKFEDVKGSQVDKREPEPLHLLPQPAKLQQHENDLPLPVETKLKSLKSYLRKTAAVESMISGDDDYPPIYREKLSNPIATEKPVMTTTPIFVPTSPVRFLPPIHSPAPPLPVSFVPSSTTLNPSIPPYKPGYGAPDLYGRTIKPPTTVNNSIQFERYTGNLLTSSSYDNYPYRKPAISFLPDGGSRATRSPLPEVSYYISQIPDTR